MRMMQERSYKQLGLANPLHGHIQQGTDSLQGLSDTLGHKYSMTCCQLTLHKRFMAIMTVRAECTRATIKPPLHMCHLPMQHDLQKLLKPLQQHDLKTA